MKPMHPLPAIPLIDVGEGGPLALLGAEEARARALLAAGRRRHTAPVLALGDRVSRAWLKRADNPYLEQLAAIARVLGEPGAVMLNLSFEWSCTTALAAVPGEHSNRMLRVLDWPMHGLGLYVVVARERTKAGPFYNVTWPGAVGVLSAMAPGRFAAAINQAPMRRHRLTLAGDWMKNRIDVWRTRALPPAHLLRQVFETAPDFATARALLTHTPLALPCLFALSGIGPHEGVVIERLETRAVVHEAQAGRTQLACANDWLSPGLGGRPRGRDNAKRQAALLSLADRPVQGFGWLRPPVLNPRTRLAVVANAAKGRLGVLGFERHGPATQEFQWVHE